MYSYDKDFLRDEMLILSNKISLQSQSRESLTWMLKEASKGPLSWWWTPLFVYFLSSDKGGRETFFFFESSILKVALLSNLLNSISFDGFTFVQILTYSSLTFKRWALT